VGADLLAKADPAFPDAIAASTGSFSPGKFHPQSGTPSWFPTSGETIKRVKPGLFPQQAEFRKTA
jgi:hypothetical protein